MHIVWDWNGTLFDDHDLVVRSVNASLAMLGVGPIDSAEYRRRFERPLHRFYERITGKPVDDALMESIDEVFQAEYANGFEQAALTSDAAAAVAAAAAAGCSQSIASMLWHELLVSSVRRFGLHGSMLALDGFRGRVGETKARHMRDHVARLGSLFGVPRADMVAIGDITDDAEAARASGIGCVLYDGGSQLRESLEATGFPVARSLSEAVRVAGCAATTLRSSV